MRTIWEKSWKVKRVWLGAGVALNDWGLPLHFNLLEGEMVCLTLLCFYFEVEWERSLADRMVEALEK